MTQLDHIVKGFIVTPVKSNDVYHVIIKKHSVKIVLKKSIHGYATDVEAIEGAKTYIDKYLIRG